MGRGEVPGGLREWVPRWWRGEGGAAGRVLDAVLAPGELLFRSAAAIRNGAYDRGLRRADTAPIPVVSVGNLAVGGAGKTPVSAWIAGRLAGWGHRPALVLRGYGADEILVHRELNPGVPVLAAAHRIEAVRQAAERGCDVAVVDDGFQHRALLRDLDIALVSADGWAQNARLLPRGPWREPLSALRRADLAIVTRKAAGEDAAEEVERALAPYVSADRIVRCRLTPTRLTRLQGRGSAVEAPLAGLDGRSILAVASLADPAPIAAQLRAVGATVELAAFADHHAFTREEAAELARRAGSRPLVMTRKEAVKLRELLPENVEAWMVDQQVEIESGGEVLDEALRRAVAP
jgi:tetraacyldisaccharide 4'-kinase